MNKQPLFRDQSREGIYTIRIRCTQHLQDGILLTEPEAPHYTNPGDCNITNIRGFTTKTLGPRAEMENVAAAILEWIHLNGNKNRISIEVVPIEEPGK